MRPALVSNVGSSMALVSLNSRSESKANGK